MINPNKSQNIKRIILTLLITSLLCLTLSVIVYRGQNFQNWLHSDYSTNKYVIIIGWFLLFVYFFICLLEYRFKREQLFIFIWFAIIYIFYLYYIYLLFLNLFIGNS